MNYNKTKHSILKLFLEVKLNYIEEYHEFREAFLTIDQIVKKKNLDYDVVKVILASLSANEEIKLQNLNVDNEYSFLGYAITNKGVFAYEDKKYLRIKTERSRANWSFAVSIASFAVSLIAILLTLQKSKPDITQVDKNAIEVKKKKCFFTGQSY
ncbi:hypothetical protein [Flavobacterium sp. CGRL2]